jgi:hypothetical protein
MGKHLGQQVRNGPSGGTSLQVTSFRTLVDHSEPGLEGRSVLSIDGSVNHAGEARPRKAVHREIMTGNRHQTPALGKPGQSRAHMLDIGSGHPPRHMEHRREGRVHEDNRGPDLPGQTVVYGGGVVGGDGCVGEQETQEGRARVGGFVEHQAGTGQLGEQGEHPRPRRGLQHDVLWPDARGLGDDEGQGKRCGELLKGLTLPRAPGLGGDQVGQAGQHGEQGFRTSRAVPHGPAIFAEEEHLGDLAGLVSVLPGPSALGVRPLEGTGKRITQDGM